MAVVTIAVTGKSTKTDHVTPSTGWAELTPVAEMVDAAGHIVMPRSTRRKDLDNTGSFSITVVASDSPGITPTNVQYRYAARIDGVPKDFLIFVPANSPGGVLDISAVTPASPSQPVPVPALFLPIIEDEGTPLAPEAVLDFQGSGVTATHSSGKIIVTVPGTVGGVSSVNGRTGTVTGLADIEQVGRRLASMWQRYATLANGAVPATTESGHAWTFGGQVPAVLGGKKINPTPAIGATYDWIVLAGQFGSLAMEWTYESAVGDTQGVAIISTVASGALLKDMLHLTFSPGTGWGLAYVVGTLSGGNPLIPLASGPGFTPVAGTKYRMAMAVDGDTIVCQLPDGTMAAMTNATAAALAGPRCAFEIGGGAVTVDPRIVAETAAVYNPAAVMAPPRDVYGVARWIASHDDPASANLGNLVAKKGDTTNVVEIGRSTALGVASLLLGGDAELYRAGANMLGTLGDVFLQGAGKGLWLTQPNGSLKYVTVDNAGKLAGVEATDSTKAQALTLTAVKTAIFTAAAGDYVPVDTTGGNATGTLQSAPPDRSRIGVKHIIRGGTNIVTLQCAGTDVFNRVGGPTSLTLTLSGQAVLLQYNASTGVYVIQADDIPLSQLDLRYLALTGGTLTGALTLAADPVGALQPATKQYADAVASGLNFKTEVRAGTTANTTLSGTQTVDGVALLAGDRVLVKAQTVGANNGIYVVAAGAWARATDADTSAKVTSGTFCFVSEGTTLADTGWVLTTNDPIILGTTALVFGQFSGPGTTVAGSGLTRSGNTLSADFGTGAGRVTQGDDARLSDTRTPSALSVTTGTIADGAVTLVKQSNAAANSFRGNNTGSAATPIDMTVAQSKALLAIAESDVTGLVADLALKAPLASPALTGSPTIGTVLVGLRGVVAESHADVPANNTTTETAVVNLSLPGGLVAAGDLVRLTANCDLLNNSGGTVTYIFKFKFGTTTLFTSAAFSIGTGTGRGRYRVGADIMMASTTSEIITATLLGTNGAAAGTWVTLAAAFSLVGYGTAAEDTSTSKAVQLTVTMNTANAAAEFVAHSSSLEIVQKR